jgi:lipoprotein signal peptidase
VKPKQKKTWNSFYFWTVGLLSLDLFLQFFFRRYQLGIANSGISFGVFQNVEIWLLFLIWGVILVWYLKKHKNSKTKAKNGLFLILAGGVGNLVARLMMGEVWDYVYLPPLPFWFNISDILISLGVVSYILGGNDDIDTV